MTQAPQDPARRIIDASKAALEAARNGDFARVAALSDTTDLITLKNSATEDDLLRTVEGVQKRSSHPEAHINALQGDKTAFDRTVQYLLDNPQPDPTKPSKEFQAAVKLFSQLEDVNARKTEEGNALIARAKDDPQISAAIQRARDSSYEERIAANMVASAAAVDQTQTTSLPPAPSAMPEQVLPNLLKDKEGKKTLNAAALAGLGTNYDVSSLSQDQRNELFGKTAQYLIKNEPKTKFDLTQSYDQLTPKYKAALNLYHKLLYPTASETMSLNEQEAAQKVATSPIMNEVLKMPTLNALEQVRAGNFEGIDLSNVHLDKTLTYNQLNALHNGRGVTDNPDGLSAFGVTAKYLLENKPTAGADPTAEYKTALSMYDMLREAKSRNGDSIMPIEYMTPTNRDFIQKANADREIGVLLSQAKTERASQVQAQAQDQDAAGSRGVVTPPAPAAAAEATQTQGRDNAGVDAAAEERKRQATIAGMRASTEISAYLNKVPVDVGKDKTSEIAAHTNKLPKEPVPEGICKPKDGKYDIDFARAENHINPDGSKGLTGNMFIPKMKDGKPVKDEKGNIIEDIIVFKDGKPIGLRVLDPQDVTNIHKDTLKGLEDRGIKPNEPLKTVESQAQTQTQSQEQNPIPTLTTGDVPVPGGPGPAPAPAPTASVSAVTAPPPKELQASVSSGEDAARKMFGALQELHDKDHPNTKAAHDAYTSLAKSTKEMAPDVSKVQLKRAEGGGYDVELVDKKFTGVVAIPRSGGSDTPDTLVYHEGKLINGFSKDDPSNIMDVSNLSKNMKDQLGVVVEERKKSIAESRQQGDNDLLKKVTEGVGILGSQTAAAATASLTPDTNTLGSENSITTKGAVPLVSDGATPDLNTQIQEKDAVAVATASATGATDTAASEASTAKAASNDLSETTQSPMQPSQVVNPFEVTSGGGEDVDNGPKLPAVQESVPLTMLVEASRAALVDIGEGLDKQARAPALEHGPTATERATEAAVTAADKRADDVIKEINEGIESAHTPGAGTAHSHSQRTAQQAALAREEEMGNREDIGLVLDVREDERGGPQEQQETIMATGAMPNGTAAAPSAVSVDTVAAAVAQEATPKIVEPATDALSQPDNSKVRETGAIPNPAYQEVKPHEEGPGSAQTPSSLAAAAIKSALLEPKTGLSSATAKAPTAPTKSAELGVDDKIAEVARKFGVAKSLGEISTSQSRHQLPITPPPAQMSRG